MSYLPALVVIVWIAITCVTVWRCVTLAEELQTCRGPRRHRSLQRQYASTIGWWIVVTGVALLPFRGGTFMLVTFTAAGLCVVVVARISRRWRTA